MGVVISYERGIPVGQQVGVPSQVDILGLSYGSVHNPGGNSGANLKSISHKCHLREVAFEWELTKETIYLPLGCLQGVVRIRPLESKKQIVRLLGDTW